jgi:glycosyltransferase involved in cell wall biosynthesis
LNRSGNAGSNPQRGISLVVPLQDEEGTIESLLRSIAAQTLTPNEIVLVDAGCRDATFSRAAALGLGLPLRVVPAGRVYPGAARNAGVEASTQEWIAFTDGGVVVDKSWLAGLVEQADASIDVVYGNYEPVCESFFSECAAIAYVSARDESATRGPSVASCLVRRDAFTRAGGFPPFRAAEDLIFIQRLIESGARTAFAPKASVRWQIAGSVPTTFRRFASYSYHNLAAGWGRHWHAGTARLYAALGIVILGASLLAGTAWIAPIVVAFLVARAGKSAYRKRKSFDFQTLTPLRILGAAGILVVVDLATLVGFTRWITARGRR